MDITLLTTLVGIAVAVGGFALKEIYKAAKAWKTRHDNHLIECAERHIKDAELNGKVENLSTNQVRIEQTLNTVAQNVDQLVLKLIPQNRFKGEVLND